MTFRVFRFIYALGSQFHGVPDAHVDVDVYITPP